MFNKIRRAFGSQRSAPSSSTTAGIKKTRDSFEIDASQTFRQKSERPGAKSPAWKPRVETACSSNLFSSRTATASLPLESPATSATPDHRATPNRARASPLRLSGRKELPRSNSNHKSLGSPGSSPLLRTNSLGKSWSFSRREGSLAGKSDYESAVPEGQTCKKLTEEEMSAKYSDLDCFQLARDMRSALPVRDRIGQVLTRVYPKTFLGGHAARYLFDVGLADSYAEAAFICDELIGQGHIYDVLDEEETSFRDGYRLYRFAADDRILPELNDGVFIVQVLVALESSVTLGDRRVGVVTHQKVFSGEEAVDAILRSKRVSNRADAVKVCERLAELGHIQRLGAMNNSVFSDCTSLYRFRKDQSNVEPAPRS